jgi:hypothetical protein
LGPFVFNPGAVPVGQQFTACASLKAGSDICSDGVNSPQNMPEHVTIRIPVPGGQQPTGPVGQQPPSDKVKADAFACFIENSNIPIVSEEWKFLDKINGIVRTC